MALTLHIMFIVLPWPLLFSLLISLDTEPASTPPKQRFSLSSVTAFVVLAVTVAVLLIVWYVAHSVLVTLTVYAKSTMLLMASQTQ